ncbi:hypothetical protein [Streptomyces sp. NPDC001056]
MSAPEDLPEHVDVPVNNAGRRGGPAWGEGLRGVAEQRRRVFDGNVLPALT